MLATAGRTAFAVTQSTPEMIVELPVTPAQPTTRTACSRTSLATPQVLPPIVPATWVP